MSENKHVLRVGPDKLSVLVSGQVTINDEGLDLLESQIAEIRKKAEAEKPKVWDFGIDEVGIRMYGTQCWSGSCGPDVPNRAVCDNDVHVLGNLKEIVEQQGQIVVGIDVDIASRLPALDSGITALIAGSGWYIVHGRIRDALARYEMNKP